MISLDQALALSSEAGWNQTLDDWRRIVTLAGRGVYGIERDGRLVASAIGLAYGRELAWIGMVLTSVAYRGQGFARTLMQRAIDDLDAAGVQCIKLDATDLGRPLYPKVGFVDERPVSRWRRKPGPTTASPLQPAPVDYALDTFGADRTALLQSFAEHESYSLPGEGFAFARPGRTTWHFGPCIAGNATVARRLLGAFLSNHAHESSILDLCDDQAEACAVAREAGYEPIRRLMRMRRGTATTLASGPKVYCLAGFEFG
ncbi:MAG: GNAT family N-acetyltransferase [Acidobacteria bacterium]|nr:GNAT family N-acetyltransferase [Acidobacteriota bacterium]